MSYFIHTDEQRDYIESIHSEIKVAIYYLDKENMDIDPNMVQWHSQHGGRWIGFSSHLDNSLTENIKDALSWYASHIQNPGMEFILYPENK